MRSRVPWLILVGLALAPAVPWPGATAAAQHQCAYCHDVHGGVAGSSTALNREAVIDDMCLTCHSDAGLGYTVTGEGTVKAVDAASLSVTVHAGSKHAAADTTHCWDCHDHQGEAGSNIFMIPEQRTGAALGLTRAIVFTDTTTQAGFLSSDGVGGATPNGVCVVCHDVAENPANTFANYNTTDGHNSPDVCTTCHSHEGGFQGEGGGCTSCHSSAKGPRRIVTDDFSRASHHVSGTLADADCEICHDQVSGHSSDANGVLLFDHDGGASIQLTYSDDPMTVPSEAAKLEAFCLGCHGDGTTKDASTAPFSGSTTIPLVDETAWLASSHEGAAAITGGCVGDGAFGCHGNGHGSNLAKLRAPYTATLNTTTLVEEEEGFCFGCHDGGTAGTDIKSQFADATINWVTAGQGVSKIATFNDRHDVQHAASSVSGAKIECYDCHDPHVDNSTRKYKLDPDTSNTPPTWPGQTAMSAFCVDCHDSELPPERVQGHSAGPMADIGLFWTLPATDNRSDKMGVSTTGGALLNPTVWIEATVGAGSADTIEIASPWAATPDTTMECLECHRPHPKAADEWPGPVAVFDFFSLQDSIRLSDGRAVAYSEPRSSMGSSWIAVIWDYGMSADTTGDPRENTGPTTGGFFCNTCHNRRGMNGKTGGCGSGNCHYHGSNGAGL